MLTLHHLENSQSFRIIWLLEELGTPYELKIYARDKTTSLAPADYKALHPAGTAPIITDDKVTLAETNAIVDYLMDNYSDGDNTLRPDKNSPQRVPYLYWLHTAQGSLMPMLLVMYIFKAMTDKTPALVRPLIRVVTQKAGQVLPMPRIKSLLSYMNEELAKSPYLAGETLTAADVVIGFDLSMIEKNKQLADIEKNYPNVAAYLQRLRAREAHQQAVKKSEQLN